MNSRSMILAAAALMITATACNKSEEPATQPQGVSFSLTFDGAAASATRATYDGLTGVWEVGDEVYAYLTSTDNVSYGPYTFTPDAAGERATFQAEITGIPDGTRIASIDAYHYDNLNAVTFDNGTISYSLPAAADGTLSYMTVSSYDYPSGSEPAASEGGTIDITEALTFTHCLSRIDIETNIPNIRDVTIGIVGGSFPSSGRLDVADGVTTAAATTALLHATPSDNFQIGIIPVDFGGDRKLRAVVVTTDGKAYTREVTVSQFARATRYTLQLNAANLTEATAIADKQAFTDISNGNYILTADLTLTEIPHLEGFSGTLDGNGHSIDISGAGTTNNEYGGIFATTEGEAAVTNLTVVAGERSADIVEGGVIVGRVNSGTLTLDNVHASGNIEADRRYVNDKHMFVGGLVGYVPYGATIHATDCSFTGNVTTNQTLVDIPKNSYVGGIVGAVETIDKIETGQEYKGVTEDKGSYIVNCKYSGTLTNTARLGAYTPEIYTGGIAGRSTGLIKDCSVTNVTINAETDNDGSGRQAKPILGNDWYEYVYNDNNSYTNVTINGEVRNGIYKGSKAAGTNTPSYSDLQ